MIQERGYSGTMPGGKYTI